MSATGTEAPASDAVRTSALLNTGEHVAARSGHYFETTEALTGEPTAWAAAASVADVHLAVDASASAAPDVARRIRSGICHINGAIVHDEPRMPFGGVGASGWGRFGSRAALEEFTELRWITIQSGSRHYPVS
ncbi:aldehyde dehydrogenase family protein [Streptomyces coriariae]|uniref:aldehyde dehydrogenase family protein n=1 Tax=Streptomyces coriariae TaxID=2864460 RepID=UPI001E50A870|nr:aldehyde dehydrogenase family protein [Streptomyces coriariae]